MNKNLRKFFFSATVLLGLATVAVSCKDYTGDFDKINQRVANLEESVKTLQSKIEAGAVISKVEPTDEGIVITLSDGKSYTVKNGANGTPGAPGAPGASSVVTIGDNGNWFINGEDTNKPSRGEDGSDGSAGPQGPAGNVVYYKPGTGENAGKWIKVTVAKGNSTEEVTNEKIADAGILTAVWNPQTGELSLLNVDGHDGALVVSTTSSLSALVPLAQSQLVSYDAFTYGQELLESKVVEDFDAKEEAYNQELPVVTASLVGGQATLTFAMNPANIDVTAYDFSLRSEKQAYTKAAEEMPFVVKSATTRMDAQRGKVLDVIVSLKDGKTFADAVKNGAKDAAISEQTLFYLVASSKKDANLVITSSKFVMLEKNSVVDARFINLAANKPAMVAGIRVHDPGEEPVDLAPHGPINVDYIYRNKLGALDFSATENMHEAWSENSQGTGKFDLLWASCDVAMLYNASLDLNTIVAVQSGTQVFTVDQLKAKGFSISFELVGENYRGVAEEPAPITNEVVEEHKQENPAQPAGVAMNAYVNLSAAGVLTPKENASGKTQAEKSPLYKRPIVRVLLKKGDKVYSVAYIKVIITFNEEPEPAPLDLTIETPAIAFECKDSFTSAVTAEMFKAQVLAKVNEILGEENKIEDLTKFDELFAVPADLSATPKAKGGVAIQFSKDDPTKALELSFNEDYAVMLTETKLSNVIKFERKVKPTVGKKLNVINITLTTPFTPAVKEFNLVEANKVSNFWTSDKSAVSFNINVPTANESQSTNAVFNNDLNSPFTTWVTKDGKPNVGQVKLPEQFTNIKYVFDAKKMAEIKTVGGLKVEYAVENNGTELHVTYNGQKSLMAQITNELTSNKVMLKNNSYQGKLLLNTGELSIYYKIEASICNKVDDDKYKATIKVDGKDSFKANYVKPIVINAVSDMSFTDGVDLGKDGSFINLEDLIGVTDWRGNKFSENENYWGFYGVKQIIVKPADVQSNLNNSKVDKPLPQTILVEYHGKTTPNDTEVSWEGKTSKYGFLTYKNNGTEVTSDFELKVPVTVMYTYGQISTVVTVRVKKTVKQQ